MFTLNTQESSELTGNSESFFFFCMRALDSNVQSAGEHGNMAPSEASALWGGGGNAEQAVHNPPVRRGSDPQEQVYGQAPAGASGSSGRGTQKLSLNPKCKISRQTTGKHKQYRIYTIQKSREESFEINYVLNY